MYIMNYLLDNGAYTIKIGEKGTNPQIFQNCLSKNKSDLIIAPCSLTGATEILRPHDRGILIDSDLQSKI